MLDKNVLVKITNRGNSIVGYVVPELNNLYRRFAAGETKEVTMDELRKLSWTPGGEMLIKNYLVIHDPVAAKELVPGAEPEYFYDADDVDNLLINGSIDHLADALDFAPEGVIALIKERAVAIKLNDVAKRDLIFKVTGFSVNNAINNNVLSEAKEESGAKTRRVALQTEETTEETTEAPQRRAAAPTFKIKK